MSHIVDRMSRLIRVHIHSACECSIQCLEVSKPALLHRDEPNKHDDLLAYLSIASFVYTEAEDVINISSDDVEIE